jgi:hypothetical protein
MRTRHKTNDRNQEEKIVYEPINNPLPEEPAMAVLFLAEMVKSWRSRYHTPELPVIA